MGGAIIGKTEYLDLIRAQSQINLGATISPFNAWLIMRGAIEKANQLAEEIPNSFIPAQEDWCGGIFEVKAGKHTGDSG